MYDLADYGAMLAHRGRTDAYAKAITRAVKPGDIVVEIGCGPGLFSLLAQRAGARRVYAIESTESIAFARELIAANRCGAQVELLRGSSRRLSLPERADVIISDIRGILPFWQDAIASIEDARSRFLAPGGTMIPAVDRLFAAIASVPEYYDGLISPWQDSEDGIRLSPMRKRVLNSTYGVAFGADKLLSEPITWAHLDYRNGAQRRTAASLQLRASGSGMAHGLCLWFETTLFEDIGYSTAPGQADNVYGQLFLPWCEPVSLEAGQQVVVDLRADSVHSNYVWRWDSRFPAKPGEADRAFSQSTLGGARFAPEILRRRSAEFVPKLSATAEAECWVMQRMDGTRSAQEIGEEAAARFPSVFFDAQEAFEVVSRLADQFAL